MLLGGSSQAPTEVCGPGLWLAEVYCLSDVKAVAFRRQKRRRIRRGTLLWKTRQQLMTAATLESLSVVSLHASA